VITCASFLGENCRPVYERIVNYLAARSGQPARLVGGLGWEEQHALIDGGDIQFAFLCGLPYAQKHDRPDRPVELLAAPVMAAPRYGGCPVYFTDVIVRANSPAQSFGDLRGRSWAFNGRDSNSGYNIPRDHLLALRETRGFFGRVVESGSHQTSIQMVLDGEVDASGIDSIVLEMELKRRPEIAPDLRTVEMIGPCPVPPVVVSRRMPAQVRECWRDLLTQMHADPEGRVVLAAGLIARFVEVTDRDYDPVREMARRAEAAGFLELK
jgi:phosphonate transport system substrate-binding protein